MPIDQAPENVWKLLKFRNSWSCSAVCGSYHMWGTLHYVAITTVWNVCRITWRNRATLGRLVGICTGPCIMYYVYYIYLRSFLYTESLLMRSLMRRCSLGHIVYEVLPLYDICSQVRTVFIMAWFVLIVYTKVYVVLSIKSTWSSIAIIRWFVRILYSLLLHHP